jgi:hypothetical protein
VSLDGDAISTPSGVGGAYSPFSEWDDLLRESYGHRLLKYVEGMKLILISLEKVCVLFYTS